MCQRCRELVCADDAECRPLKFMPSVHMFHVCHTHTVSRIVSTCTMKHKCTHSMQHGAWVVLISEGSRRNGRADQRNGPEPRL